MKSLSDAARKAAEVYFLMPRGLVGPQEWFSAIQTLERMTTEAELDEWAELLSVSNQAHRVMEDALQALSGLPVKMRLGFLKEFYPWSFDHWKVSLSVSFARDKLSMLKVGFITEWQL